MPRISEAHELSATVRWLARKAIKEQIRRSGIHLLDVEPGDITRAADAYLMQHSTELVERARAMLKMNDGTH